MDKNTEIEFLPGSKLTIVAGGYQGGQETKGIVLGVEKNRWGETVNVAVYECHCEEVHYVEGFHRHSLEADLRRGRLEGSLAHTTMTRPDGVVYGE